MVSIFNGMTCTLSEIVEEGKEQIKKSYADDVKEIEDTIVSLNLDPMLEVIFL